MCIVEETEYTKKRRDCHRSFGNFGEINLYICRVKNIAIASGKVEPEEFATLVF